MNKIWEIYRENLPKYREWITKRTDISKGIGIVELEVLIDELPMRVINSKQAKLGFKDDMQIRKYLFAALERNIYYLHSKKKKEERISTKEMLENFELAKSIIDKNRSIANRK